MAPAYHLRPETPDDLPLHAAIYASTRQDEMDAAGFSPEMRESFVAMQFQAQNTHYRQHFPRAEWSIIECDGQPAGRLILDREEDHLHIMDIALLPAFRNRGIGSDLLTKLCAEAGPLAVRLYAQNNDRAIHLYRRLGFRPVSDDGMNTELIWRREEPTA